MRSYIETMLSGLMVDHNIVSKFATRGGKPVQFATTIRPIRGRPVELNAVRDEMTGACTVVELKREMVTEVIEGELVTTVHVSPIPVFGEDTLRIFPNVKVAFTAAEREIRKRTPRR